VTEALVRGTRNALVTFAMVLIVCAYLFGTVSIGGLDFGMGYEHLPSDRGIVRDPNASGGWK
jgi:hypothetical protein